MTTPTSKRSGDTGPADVARKRAVAAAGADIGIATPPVALEARIRIIREVEPEKRTTFETTRSRGFRRACLKGLLVMVGTCARKKIPRDSSCVISSDDYHSFSKMGEGSDRFYYSI